MSITERYLNGNPKQIIIMHRKKSITSHKIKLWNFEMSIRQVEFRNVISVNILF